MAGDPKLSPKQVLGVAAAIALGLSVFALVVAFIGGGGLTVSLLSAASTGIVSFLAAYVITLYLFGEPPLDG
jgi:hypothetical protein